MGARLAERLIPLALAAAPFAIASPVRADTGAAAAKAADAGTLRAGALIVPPSVRAGREQPELPPMPDSLGLLGAPEVMAALGPFRPEVGAWAEYRMTQKRTGDSVRVLVSVLPPPMPDGSYWLEIDSLASEILPMATRLLVHGEPTDPRSLRRVLIQVPGQNLLELPMSMLAKVPEKLKPGPLPSNGAKVTTTPGVKLKVAAGEFTADKVQVVKGKDRYLVWRSNDVPLFGLVRSEGKASITELVAAGHTGAHSLLGEVGDDNVPVAGPQSQGNGSDNKK